MTMTDAEMFDELSKVIGIDNMFYERPYLYSPMHESQREKIVQVIDSLRVRVEAEKNCEHAYSTIRASDNKQLTICLLCGNKKAKNHA